MRVSARVVAKVRPVHTPAATRGTPHQVVRVGFELRSRVRVTVRSQGVH